MFSHIFKNHFIFSFCELFLHSFFPFFYWSIFFPKSFLHILDKMLFCDINCNIFPIFNCFFCCLQDICPFRGGFFFYFYVFEYNNLTRIPGRRICCGGGNMQMYTDYRNPVEKKGLCGRSPS